MAVLRGGRRRGGRGMGGGRGLGGGGAQGAGGGVRRFDGSGGGVGNIGTPRQPRRTPEEARKWVDSMRRKVATRKKS